jgi:Cys-tRNA(Pro) deacylase
MTKHVSETPATHYLRQHGIVFHEHHYPYEDHGGTAAFAKAWDVPARHVIKTLVMQNEKSRPLIVLMHGDCSVSTKNLARQIGCKSVSPCTPDVAHRHSGYLVGGTSPFATRKSMPIYAERSIFNLEKIYINGGRRGYLISLAPAQLPTLLTLTLVDCALPITGSSAPREL